MVEVQGFAAVHSYSVTIDALGVVPNRLGVI